MFANRLLLFAVVLAALTLALPACGGARDEEDDPAFPDSCLPPFSEGLSGAWYFQEVLAGEDCATTGLNQGAFFMLQDYRGLTFQGQQTVWQATLCGSRATGGPFAVPRNGGVHTVETILIQFQSTTSATGTTTWSWTNGSETCSGTSTFDMTQ
jgi:hypothetical protein